MGRRWYWKAYFVLMAVLTASGIGLSFYFWGDAAMLDRIADLASLPLYIVQLVGLFGFIYWRRFGSPLLWKFVFAATLLELAWASYQTVMETRSSSSGELTFILGMSVAATLLLLPLLVALYLYAFRSHVLWASR